MIVKLLKKQKRSRTDDNINQVILFIKHLIAKNSPKSMDVFQLCNELKEYGWFIDVSIEQKLPPTVPSLWLEHQGQYVILYRDFPFPLLTQLRILHELSHILLGHSPFTEEDIIYGRSIYTHSEEMEAELIACQVLSLLSRIEYDNYVLRKKYPSAIVKPHHNEHIFREVMDIPPSTMTEEDKKISQRMSEFFAL